MADPVTFEIILFDEATESALSYGINRKLLDPAGMPQKGERVNVPDEEGPRWFVVKRRDFHFANGACCVRVYLKEAKK